MIKWEFSQIFEEFSENVLKECKDKSFGIVNITTHEPAAVSEIFGQEKVPKLIIDITNQAFS